MPNYVQPCLDCPRKYKAIGGDGPQPSPVLCIGERPGKYENAQGRVFCGPTGQEYDELYLPLAGLDRSTVRTCNTVLCWQDNNKTPTDKDIASCAPYHLPGEIKRTDPEVILLLGSTACSLVPGIRLELHHGVPQSTTKVGDLFGWQGWLVPMFHPAIGLHESRWMQICIEDWQELGAILGEDHFEDDPEPEEHDYQIADDSLRDLQEYEHGPVAVDTESHGGAPWSVQYSTAPGVGRLVLVRDWEALSHLRRSLHKKEVILHNAAYDLEVLRRLGIHVRSYRDTMQEAFQLGNLPQGLKPLVYRLFRHTMLSYEEIVWPASIRALQDWILEAIQIAEQDLSFTEHVHLKTKVKEVVKAGDLERLCRRLLRLMDAASEYNPWGSPDEPRLDAFWRDELNGWMVSHVEARIGPYPVLGIANCSMEDAVRYAVGDADYTGKVAVELARRRGEQFKIYSGDSDV